MHSGNIGVNSQGLSVKIDGDWSFGILRLPNQANDVTINEFQTIERLPKPPDNSSTWFYSDRMDKLFINDDIDSNVKFRNEINSGLLKIILLPDKYLEKFISTYAENESPEPYINLLQERGKKIKYCAFLYLDFYKYMESEAAQCDLKKLLNSVKDFKVNGEIEILVPNEMEKILEQISQEFETVQNYCKSKKDVMVQIDKALSSRLVCSDYLLKISDINQIIKYDQIQEWISTTESELKTLFTIEGFDEKRLKEEVGKIKMVYNVVKSVSEINVKHDNDVLLKTWLDNKKNELGECLNKNPVDIDEVEKLHKEIELMKSSLCSVEVEYIEQEIARLNQGSTQLTIGKENKAKLLLDALLNTNPLQRGTVLSSEDPNSVRELIYSGRLLLKFDIKIVKISLETKHKETFIQYKKNWNESFESQKKKEVESEKDQLEQQSKLK